jgi:predicted Zn finger-like uncharacterized protein
MKFACPQCSKKYNLGDDKLAARDTVRLKCRQCGEQITVKDAGQLMIAPLPQALALEGASDAPSPLPSDAPPMQEPSAAETVAGHGAPPSPRAGDVVANLTPPLPPLTRAGTPPPPPPLSTRASERPQNGQLLAAGMTTLKSEPGAGLLRNKALASAGEMVKFGPAKLSALALAKLASWGLDEHQRVWTIFGLGLVLGLLLGAIF